MSDKLLFAELTPRESDAIKGGMTYKLDFSPPDYGSKFNHINVENHFLGTQQGTALSFKGDAYVANDLTQDATTNIEVKA